ncbi:MAG: ribosome biogenesis GTPase Der [Treponema sp.]|nr:ribosome biogenesis GTPase Der [Treponema sp.]
MIPMVVLAGRPNVGKSTLFNRLLHKRRAITDPTPGVTRDPISAETLIRDVKIKLVDTGGFKLDRDSSPEGSLEAAVVERTLETIKQADLIILILEAGEVTAEDEEFIGLLRPYQKKLLPVVNKCEGGRREADAWNLLSLGFEKILMISAEHGDNIGDLEDTIASRLAKYKISGSANNPDSQSGIPNFIRIALLGKPNTGKSTLSNRLTASAASIVTDIPGTTRDVVEGTFSWKNRNFLVLDTAGIRRKTKVTENIEYYSVNRAIKTIDEAEIVFLIIDAQEGLTDQDKKIAALAHEKGRGIILILNKWDAMPQIKNAFAAAEDRVRFLFPKMEYAPVIGISARDGTNTDKLLDIAIRMYGQLNRRIETAELNRAVERWMAEYPPPVGRQTHFKIRYAVQLSANPVKFVFFVSRKQAVTEPYTAYLRNRVRKDLGFSLIPVEIEIRASSDKADPNRANYNKTNSGRASRFRRN